MNAEPGKEWQWTSSCSSSLAHSRTRARAGGAAGVGRSAGDYPRGDRPSSARRGGRRGNWATANSRHLILRAFAAGRHALVGGHDADGAQPSAVRGGLGIRGGAANVSCLCPGTGKQLVRQAGRRTVSPN
jgi:hypothetical protein